MKDKVSLSQIFLIIVIVFCVVFFVLFVYPFLSDIHFLRPSAWEGGAGMTDLNTSIGILNVVASLMGALVGLFTLILMVVAAVAGFFGYREWKSIRGYVVQAKNAAQEAEKCAEAAKPILEWFEKQKEEAEAARKEIGQLPPLWEAPSEELGKKLEEYGKKIELLENFGVPLKFEDYFAKAADFYYKGKYDLTLEALDRAIKLKPDDADAWVTKGAVSSELGRYEEALKACNKAIELKPDLVNAWYVKEVALIKLGRYEEALKACEKAIELKPNDAYAWYDRACAYSLKGDKENALKDLSRAIELNAKYKEMAKKDKDFEKLWGDEDFKRIVG